MRLFVFEYLCSGALDAASTEHSLLAEGRAMLLAVLEDLSRESDWTCSTSWSHQLGAPPSIPRVEFTVTRDAADESHVFDHLCRSADRTLLIAPETGGILTSRRRMADQSGAHCLCCSSDSIDLCSDKLRLGRWLEQHRIPTPATQPWSPHSPITFPFPVVVKPRDGAGSIHTWRIDSTEQLDRISKSIASRSLENEWVVQPLVAGQCLSVVAIIAPARRPNCPSAQCQVWPACRQSIEFDAASGHIHYLGGSLLDLTVPRSIEQLVGRVVENLPGLSGYIGLDLIDPGNGEPLLLEINPRLTTSYLGYRQATVHNLSRRLIRPEEDDQIAWRLDQPIHFTPFSIDR